MRANASEIGEFRDILDARTAEEYAESHIPGAVNMPALSDAERADIGAQHKQDAFSARRTGAAAIAVNIAGYLRTTLAERPPDWTPLVYCSRGGQRSGAIVEIMRRIGWQAHQLNGGYKAYRRHVLTELDNIPPRLSWVVIAGKTGVGKTRLLHALAAGDGVQTPKGVQTLDLEKIANHRGSVFGGNGAQPSQKHFESLLHCELSALSAKSPVFVESESGKIGAVRLPPALLTALHNAVAVRVDADFSQRTAHILAAYRDYCADAAAFAQTVRRLARHAPPAKIERWLLLHDKGEWTELVGDLLRDFYDVGYDKSLRKNYAAAYCAPPLTMNPNDDKSLAAAATAILKKAEGSLQPLQPQ